MRGRDPRIHAHDTPDERARQRTGPFNRSMDCGVKPGNDALRKKPTTRKSG
jgi:hypothetical protein